MTIDFRESKSIKELQKTMVQIKDDLIELTLWQNANEEKTIIKAFLSDFFIHKKRILLRV